MSEPRLSRTAQAIAPSVFAELAARIDARVRGGGDVIELSIGDTHLVPPEVARFGRVDACTAAGDGAAFDAPLYRYGAPLGLGPLKEAFAASLDARGHGPPGVDPSRHVLVASGATHALFCALRAVLDPGDEVLLATPAWPLASGVIRAAGGVPVEVPLSSVLYADPSRDPASLLEAAMTPRTRAIWIITPNNPDGKVLSGAQLARVAALAQARDLWVVADEVYADYVFDGVHASIARVEGMAERTISAYSLSKSHGLAGARVGFAVAPERVVAVARRVATHTVFNVPVAAQRVALAALGAPAAWTDDARREYRAARDATLAALDGSGVRAFLPEGGSYVFVDFAPVLGDRPLLALLERAVDQGVLLAPGAGFGAAFASCARLCFTSVSRPRLIEGIGRLRAAIDAIAG